MKFYRIRPADVACLHCWIRAAISAYIKVAPTDGLKIVKHDDGSCSVDIEAVVASLTRAAAQELQTIAQTDSEGAVRIALWTTEGMLKAAGVKFPGEDDDVDERRTLQ
jgi:hypothetical protein